MTSIKVDELVGKMLQAASEPLKDGWTGVKSYAETEFRKYCDSIARIQKMKDVGDISQERAQQHMAIQKEALSTALLTAAGLKKLAVEQAINAAISVVRDTVNTAIGWPLL